MARSHIEDIEAIALRNVVCDTDEYFVRKICRWYSRELNTPIAEVLRLPWDQVLLEYFEAMYDNMDEGELAHERVRLLETDEERDAREMTRERQRAAEFAGEAAFAKIVEARASQARQQTPQS